jgi:hypothetical protein
MESCLRRKQQQPDIFNLRHILWRTAADIYLQPVLATIISLSLGNDQLNILKIFSAILIFSGVYLVSRPVEKSN